MKNRRIGRQLAAALFSVASAATLVSAPAGAEIATYAQDTWGVYNSITSGTLTDRIDSEVMAIERIGNLIYVGGKFTDVRQTPTSAPVNQQFLAAFDAQTGAYVSSFDVDLSGPVYALQASPDGSRLFIGGEFGDVAGVPNTQALVAVNPTTGAVDSAWRAQIKRDGRAVVYELDATASWLYVGGSFDGVGGEGFPRVDVSNATRLSLGTAIADPGFDPAPNGSVWGIVASPDETKVYLSGYFTGVNNVSGSEGFVVVNTTGDLLATPLNGLHNNTSRKIYLDVEAVNGLVFVAGMEHIVWVLNAANNSVVTRHSTGGTTSSAFQTGGDYQDLEVVDDRVYGSNHARGSHFANGDIYSWLIGRGGSWTRQDPIKFVAAYSALDGSYLPSFQLDVSGSSGVWGMTSGPDGCMWFGGDLTRATRANGTNQSRGGFTKHCDTSMVTDTVKPSVPTNFTVVASGNNAVLNWTAATDNVGVAGYEVYRAATNGGVATRVGTSSSTSFTDPGLANGTYWYYLKAYDAAGNVGSRTAYKSVVISQVVTDTVRPSTPAGLKRDAVTTTSTTLSWTASTDNIGVVGYQVYNSSTNTLLATVTTTSVTVTGRTPGTSTTYYVKAYDAAGNESYRSNLVAVANPL